MNTPTPTSQFQTLFPELPQPISAECTSEHIAIHFDDSSSFVKTIHIINEPDDTTFSINTPLSRD